MIIQRKFIAGEEWLFYKIYAGIAIQNKLLLGEVFHAVNFFYNEGIIDKFFFIRYYDHEGPHLRLRFHLIDSNGFGEIITFLTKTLKDYVRSRVISKITLDTYCREIERYGGVNLVNIETVFSVNSWIVLNIYRQCFNKDEQLWLASIKIVDDLLDDVEYNFSMKHSIHKLLYKAFEKKLKLNGSARDMLNMKYRENSQKIADRISSPLDYEALEASPFLLRAVQKKALQEIAGNRFQSLPLLDNVLGDIIHMVFNRFFSVNQNTVEMVIYYMMHKYYKSKSIEEQKKAVDY